MGEEIESKKELREKKKASREKIGDYFLHLSQLTYTALVLGAVVMIFQSGKFSTGLFLMSIVGGIIAYVWAKVGEKVLNN